MAVTSSSDTSVDTPVKEVVDNQHEHQVNRSGKRRRLFKKAEADGEKVEDQMPAKYAHIRDSERTVKDAFYLTGEPGGYGHVIGRGVQGCGDGWQWFVWPVLEGAQRGRRGD